MREGECPLEASVQWLRARGFPVGSVYRVRGCQGDSAGLNPPQPVRTLRLRRARLWPGRAGIDDAASHDTSRGAYSNRC